MTSSSIKACIAATASGVGVMAESALALPEAERVPCAGVAAWASLEPGPHRVYVDSMALHTTRPHHGPPSDLMSTQEFANANRFE